MDVVGGPEGWSVTFLQDRLVGGAAEIAGLAHETTPWRAVQRAAWQALQGAKRTDGGTAD